MKIIQVRKPLQDQFTRNEDVELIDGEKKYWFTITSLYTESQGGLDSFFKEIEKRVRQKRIKGIYLYQTGEYKRKIGSFTNEVETVYYASWDFYD